ncbi:MAG: zf-HC2 domain-containing protein [Archangiaceae bacterium]|nr:zf-HC2 domain-containing protein [Archangiaceae bacterium]
MDCRELDNLLYAYLDGELVDDERVAVEGHLAGCDACRAATDREHSTLLLIRSRAKAGGARAPDALRERLSQKLGDELKVRRVRAIGRLAAAAAGLAVCTVVAHSSWRSHQRRLYVEDAVNRHARSFPLEIEKPSPEQLEAWFDGKLDHRVAVPRFQNVVTQGGRLLNVRDRQAAYIRYDDRGRRLGLFVYSDKPGDVDVTEPEVDRSNGFNTVTWRDGDVVYTLVTDLDDDDIRQMLPQHRIPEDAVPAHAPTVQPAAFSH